MPTLPIASSSGSFLITPNVGLMIWTLVVFAISLYILSKAVYPRRREALDSPARQTADVHEREAQEEAKAKRDQAMEQTRRDIEAETRRAIQEIRKEVADLTVLATEKVTRKTLTEEDQRRLIDDAMSELDFSTLGASEGQR